MAATTAKPAASDAVYAFEAAQDKQQLPDIRPGDVVRVHQQIKEGEKDRVQAFEGTVIKINHGRGINGTFTVRRVVDGFGVERIFPFQLPSIKKVEILKRNKVRRAKLYYLRRLQQKAARLVEKKTSREELAGMTYDGDAIAAAKAKVAEEKAAVEEAAKKAAEEAAKPAEEVKVADVAAPEEAPAVETKDEPKA